MRQHIKIEDIQDNILNSKYYLAGHIARMENFDSKQIIKLIVSLPLCTKRHSFETKAKKKVCFIKAIIT